MLQKLLEKFGYVPAKPGMVELTIDEAEIVAEALEIYKNRLPNTRFGFFSENARSASEKIESVRPPEYRRFIHIPEI